LNPFKTPAMTDQQLSVIYTFTVQLNLHLFTVQLKGAGSSCDYTEIFTEITRK
jgi:hypothetical protein